MTIASSAAQKPVLEEEVDQEDEEESYAKGRALLLFLTMNPMRVAFSCRMVFLQSLLDGDVALGIDEGGECLVF